MKFFKIIAFVILFLFASYLLYATNLNLDESTGGIGWDGFAFLLFLVAVFFVMAVLLIRFIYRSLILK